VEMASKETEAEVNEKYLIVIFEPGDLAEV
jgi:hypothetical protein